MVSKLRPLLLPALSLGLLLSACGQNPTTTLPPTQPNTSKPVKSLGMYELQVNNLRAGGQATAQVVRSGLSAQASEISGISFGAVSTTTMADSANKVLHITATARVTNNSGADISVPTYIPVDTAGTGGTDGETPFRNVTNAKGTPIMPPAGMQVEKAHQNSGAVIQVDPNATPLNDGLDTGALTLSLPAGTTVAGISHKAWQTTTLANGASQDVNFAISVPLQGSDLSDADPFRFSLIFAVADKPSPLAGVTNIATIQGSTPNGDAPTTVTGPQTVEGVVTSTSLNSTDGINGFFVQEEGMDADSDPTTSNGIFVYCGTGCANYPVTVGSLVRVTGTPAEFQNQTQLAGSLTVTTLATGFSLPAPAELTLPLPVGQRERYEGMRVHVKGVVSSNYQLGRGGLLDIADSRPVSYTQDHAPSVAGYSAYVAQLADRSIRIDDASLVSNGPTVRFARNGGPLSVANILRTGDSADVTGVMAYRYDGWSGSANTYRIYAEGKDALFSGPERPAQPDPVGGTSRVASMNIENFFTTLLKTNEGCTPNGIDSTSRGAVNCAEYKRKVDKLVNVFVGLNADVIGLNELQNYGKYAVETVPTVQILVNALNDRFGPDTYAAVLPGKTIGGDVIAVGYIYRKAAFTPVGKLGVLDNSFNSTYTDSCSRPTLAQTFQSNANGGRFTMVVVHLKSKGSACTALGDADQKDGQGAGWQARLNAAKQIHNWLATDPTGTAEQDVVVMGDMNSYLAEPPVQAVLSGPDGINGTADDFISQFDAQSYSYQYDAAFGSLDHAFASPTFNSQIVGKTKWHINSDESVLYKSDFEYKNVTGCSLSGKTPCTSPDLYTSGAFASSDHDPIVLGVNLEAQTPIQPPVQPATTTLSANPTTLTVTADGTSSATSTLTTATQNYTGGNLTITTSNAAGLTVTPSASSVGPNATFTVSVSAPAGTAAGTYPVTVTTAGDGGAPKATATINVTVNGPVVTPPTGTGKLIISEFRFRGPSGAADEFIELYNAGTAAMDISGFKVDGNTNNAATWSNRATIPANKTLQAGQFYLLALTGSGGYSGSVTPDTTYTTGIADNRAVRVTDATGTVIDLVGFVAASANSAALCEGTCIPNAAASVPAGQQNSYARNVVNGQISDTNDNATDFTLRTTTANPQNSSVTFSGSN